MRQRFGSLFGSSMRMRLRLWLRNRKWHEKLTWKPPREREKVTEKWRETKRARKRKRECWQHSTPSANASAVVYLLLFKLIISSQAGGGLQGGHSGVGQGSLSGSVPIRSLFHKQTRLPRRSFNKVCRRLDIKISCELALIFYLFVFAVWLSVFCSPSLPSPLFLHHFFTFFLPFIRTRFCCGLLLINSKSFSTRMRAVSVCVCVCVLRSTAILLKLKLARGALSKLPVINQGRDDAQKRRS